MTRKLAAENTVDFDIALTKKVGAGMFGGEGLFLATLSGNGKVILQSMNITSLARTLFKNSVKSSPEDRTGGNVLGGLGSILGEFGDKY